MGTLSFRTDVMGDLRWTYSGATYQEVVACRNNPTAWFDANVERRDPDKSCDNPEGNKIRDTTTIGDKKYRIWGTCGTIPIYANGHRLAIHEAIFFADLEEREGVSEERSFFASDAPIEYLDELRMRHAEEIEQVDPNKFFDHFDIMLKKGSAHHHGVEVRVYKADGTVEVHVEIGFSDTVIRAFRAAVQRLKEEYALWLVNPNNQRLDRYIVFVEADGTTMTKKPLSKDSYISSINAIIELDEYPPLNPCSGIDCFYSACNADSGDAFDIDEDNGRAEVYLEVIESKKYCRRADGSRC